MVNYTLFGRLVVEFRQEDPKKSVSMPGMIKVLSHSFIDQCAKTHTFVPQGTT